MSLGIYLHVAWQRLLIDRLMPIGDRDFLGAQCGADDEVWHGGTA
jgi:hypothetical protein